MALIDDINALPTTVGDGHTGHLANHQVIHSALKNHESRITADKSTLDARVPSNMALRVDTSVGTRIFAGNTMIYGDTGWRSVPHSGESGELLIRRVNNVVEMHFRDFVVGGTGVKILLSFSYGFVPSVPQYGLLVDRYLRALPQVIGSRNGLPANISWLGGVDGSTTPTTELTHANLRWITNQGWLNSLPGTEATL